MKNGNIPSYVNQEEFERNLPKTVEILKSKEGHKIFVIGTVHFSTKSQDDVSVVIRNTKPSVVLLELCPMRRYVLELDEKTLLEEASSMDNKKMRAIITEKGLVTGLFYISFLKTNANITKQLGVAPGGECRRAMQECRMLKDCRLILGDRSIDVTMQRALKPLSIKQKLQLTSFFSDPKINELTQAEVEKYKVRDIDYLKNLKDQFPSVYRSFVTERDQILAHNLMLATKLTENNYSNIVGIVGIGHLNGILQNFGKTNAEDIKKIMVKDLDPPKPNNIITRLLHLLKILRYK